MRLLGIRGFENSITLSMSSSNSKAAHGVKCQEQYKTKLLLIDLRMDV